MRPRFTIAALAAGAAVVLSAAWATTAFNTSTAPSGAHYKQGFGEPVCTVDGLSISCSGTQIGGVGNNDADLLLSVAYAATCTCTNNGGKLVDVKTQVTTSSTSDDLTDVRNGTLVVSAIEPTTPPTTQSFLDAAVCPNGNWTKALKGSATISSYSYTLTFQGYTQAAITLP